MTFHVNGLKKTIVLALMGTLILLCCGEASMAQKNFGKMPVTIQSDSINFADVFLAVWKQTGMQAFYNDEQLSSEEVISINVKNEPLDNVLYFLLHKRKLNWYYREETFVILPIKDGDTIRGQMPLLTLKPLSIQVSGLVTDEDEIPLENATIYTRDSKRGSYTTREGLFSLMAPPPSVALTISCIGFQTQVVTSTGKPVKIRLKREVSGLDEVRVIGYGKTSRRTTTGAISRVNAEEIKDQPVGNVLPALAGRVPGLSIIQLSGIPGSNFQTNIRGRSSIGSGNSPLFVLDGVPLPSSSLSWDYRATNGNNYMPQTASGLGANGSSSFLNVVSIGDIEAVDVLKDADATAIFGSRGANGVILITTKKGAPSAGPQLNVNVYSGVEQTEHLVPYLENADYLTMRREAFRNDGVTPGPTDYDVNGKWDTTRRTDWQRAFLGGTGAVTDAQAAVNGGNLTLRYMVSGNFRRETTVFPGNYNYRKGGGRANLYFGGPDRRWRNFITVSYTADKNLLPSLDPAIYATTSPITPAPYLPSGNINFEDGFDNPYAALLRNYCASTDNFLVSATSHYGILPWLEFKLGAGYNRLTMQETQINPKSSFNPVMNVTSGNSYFSYSNLKNWILEPQLTVDKMVGQATLSVVTGATFQQETRAQQIFFATKYSDDTRLGEISQAGQINAQGSNWNNYHYSAVFGRLTYNLDKKYLLNATARRDGSSRVGPKQKFAVFGSMGAAWIFSEEDWSQEHVPALSFGKIRASYGVTGNDQIQDYRTLDPGNAQTPGSGQTQIAADDYRWERVKKAELGLELGFFKDRLLLWSSLYHNVTSDLIMEVPIQNSTGFNSMLKNTDAKVLNKGLELEISATAISRKDFKWSITANYTLPQNKLLRLPTEYAHTYDYYFTVGQPLDIFKGFQMQGVDPARGIYKFKDLNGDGKIDLSDYHFTVPFGVHSYGAIQNKFNYKGFELKIMLQYIRQNGYDYQYAYTSPGPGIAINQPRGVMNRWQQPRDPALLQQFTQDPGSPLADAFAKALFSDQAITSADFLRLRSLFFSYTLPTTLCKKLTIRGANIYLEAQNVFTITSYPGRNPETSYKNSEITPPLRIITAGFQLHL